MERVWSSRLRWRLRGAALVPVLAVALVADGVLLSALPIAGEGPDLVGGLLLAAFLNLVAVAALAPVLGAAIRRWRPDLPSFVARDRAAVALVLALLAGILAGGLLHRETLARHHAAADEALARGIAWIGAHPRAPAAVRRHVALADVEPILDGRLYRVCVPRRTDARGAFCAVVDVDAAYPAGIRYGGAEPNASFRAGLR
jgi:hypothetical protein